MWSGLSFLGATFDVTKEGKTSVWVRGTSDVVAKGLDAIKKFKVEWEKNNSATEVGARKQSGNFHQKKIVWFIERILNRAHVCTYFRRKDAGYL